MTTLHGDCIGPVGAKPYCGACPHTWTCGVTGRTLTCEHHCHGDEES